MSLRLLVADGNTPAGRKKNRSVLGATASQSYAALLRRLCPGAQIDICFPADADPLTPAPLSAYDAVVVTGSSLNIHRREIESLRQVDFFRAVFACGLPAFGSCWGLQLTTVAAGGDVRANPRGIETPFARRVTLTEAGRNHPLHAGRTSPFDAPAIHADEVTTLPPGATVTATNAMTRVQAVTFAVGRSVVWAVQYHPEFSLFETGSLLRSYGPKLVEDGRFASTTESERLADDLLALERDPARRDIADRLAIGPELLTADRRATEITNWLAWLGRRASGAQHQSEGPAS